MKYNYKKILIYWGIGIIIAISFTLFAKLTGIGRLFQIQGPAYSFKELIDIFIRNPFKYLAFFLLMGGLIGNGFYIYTNYKKK